MKKDINTLVEHIIVGYIKLFSKEKSSRHEPSRVLVLICQHAGSAPDVAPAFSDFGKFSAFFMIYSSSIFHFPPSGVSVFQFPPRRII